MPGLMQNVIVDAAPDPATRSVRLTWSNGSVTLAEFAGLDHRGVFAAFDDAAFFGRVQVLDEGHVLAWPGDLEFDADALWFEAHPEEAPAAAILPS